MDERCEFSRNGGHQNSVGIHVHQPLLVGGSLLNLPQHYVRRPRLALFSSSLASKHNQASGKPTSKLNVSAGAQLDESPLMKKQGHSRRHFIHPKWSRRVLEFTLV